MSPLESFCERIRDIRASSVGTPELSYRAALENLLNAVGTSLAVPVHATAELADTGAGRPDFGLVEINSGGLRGVVEVKAPSEDVPATADGSQVTRYWQRYGVVLVTNYRDFLLVVRQPENKSRVEGRFRLAADAESFWRAKPREVAKEHGEAFIDFLIGVMTRAAAIGRPQDLAEDLARHAREAKRRIEHHDVAALAPLQTAMEQALGLHFTGKEGLDFFRSSLVQTLFYGLFSGWMLWRQTRRGTEPFDWKDASEHLALPLIGDLYEEIARPKRLADLGLREPLEWATTSLNRVDEAEFFQRFDADHAITLFYEPFLEAFDPHLRKELGVWYTPPEIVQYQVSRVDELLRSELGIANGLADENVLVLDPAAGTASYILEVARCIHRTLVDQGHGALATAKVKQALCSRVFGFEILPAPYVVAHLQLGVLLRSLGTNLARDERCEVYLTNALTGWEPPKGAKQTLQFKFLEDEREAAQKVKRDAPILVILGNPPYNRFAGVAEEEEADLIEPYKTGLFETWGVRKQLLDDLYIRFFRLAERRIAEVGGRGIVSFISNYSWLEGLSHPVMRERLATGFDEVWVDNCNGDKYRTGKRTPDGLPDESMFTTDDHRIGIQVGTAIATFVKRNAASKSRKTDRVAKVHYREFWGTGNEKRSQLVKSLAPKPRGVPKYERVIPRPTMRWVFVDGALGKPTVYESWPKFADIFLTHFSGVNENRQSSFIAVDRKELEARLKVYFNKSLDLDEVAERIPGIAFKAAGYSAVESRKALLALGGPDPSRIMPVAYRPFDDWWIYAETRAKLLNRARPDFIEQVWQGNLFLSASQIGRKGGFNTPTIVDKFGDLHLQDPWSQFFPLFVRHTGELGGERIEPNIAPQVLEKLCASAKIEPFVEGNGHWSKPALQLAESLFFHALAILWSPAYQRENDAALRQDWPRVPIPMHKKALDASAKLGRVVADLLLPDKPVPGVTVGKLKPEVRDLGNPSKVGGGHIDPDRDLRVKAGWGFRGQKNAVMCGKGRVLPNAADPKHAVDVYLNDQVFWSNVPNGVWSLTIGGYPVLKKWLSYREHDILERSLRLEEVTYVTEVVRRLQALLLLGVELDQNYRDASAETLE